MSREQILKEALALPLEERVDLAQALWGSIADTGNMLDDEDEGMAEARRRDAELDANPSLGVSLEELDRRVRERRH